MEREFSEIIGHDAIKAQLLQFHKKVKYICYIYIYIYNNLDNHANP